MYWRTEPSQQLTATRKECPIDTCARCRPFAADKRLGIKPTFCRAAYYERNR